MIIDITNNHLITFTFQFDPTITAKLRTIPGCTWVPSLKSWAAQWSPLSAWLCLKSFPNKELYSETFWNIIQNNLFSKQNDSINYPEFLYPFQRTGANFLHSIGNAILADCPGAGKTLQAIASAHQEESIAICCPVSMVYQWESEVRRFNEDDVSIIKTKKCVVKKTKWVIFPHSLVAPLHKSIIAAQPSCLIVDEVHVFRNYQNKSTQALMAIGSRVPKVIPVTGTPIYNEVEDLFPLLVATKQLTINDYWFFLDRYCGKNLLGGKANKSYGLTNKEELKEFVGRITLKRDRSEIGRQLPPITRTTQVVDLTNHIDYLDKVTDTKKWIKEEAPKETTVNRLIKINALRKISAMGKTQAAKEKIENLISANEKVVVICSFLDPLSKLKGYFPDSSVTIDGSMSAKQRRKCVEEFQASQSCQIALCSMEAGGVGITLTAARYLIALDTPWTAAQIQQFEARIYRESQEMPTFVVYLIGKDTIDKEMLSIAKRKGEWAESIFATGKDESYVEAIGEIERYISQTNV